MKHYNIEGSIFLTSGPLINEILSASLRPLSSAPDLASTQGYHVYCYDTNGDALNETLDAFIVYTRLENKSEWLYLNEEGKFIKTTSPHTAGKCSHPQLGCQWFGGK